MPEQFPGVNPERYPELHPDAGNERIVDASEFLQGMNDAIDAGEFDEPIALRPDQEGATGDTQHWKVIDAVKGDVWDNHGKKVGEEPTVTLEREINGKKEQTHVPAEDFLRWRENAIEPQLVGEAVPKESNPLTKETGESQDSVAHDKKEQEEEEVNILSDLWDTLDRVRRMNQESGGDDYEYDRFVNEQMHSIASLGQSKSIEFNIAAFAAGLGAVKTPGVREGLSNHLFDLLQKEGVEDFDLRRIFNIIDNDTRSMQSGELSQEDSMAIHIQAYNGAISDLARPQAERQQRLACLAELSYAAFATPEEANLVYGAINDLKKNLDDVRK